MFKVGLTGGIGSGKTLVANLFAKKNVPIIDTDQIARDVVTPHTEAYTKIVKHFGSEILDAKTHAIKRRLLREKIFNNPHEKAWLELLLHPLIRKNVEHTVATLHAAYCILVIPLLFESTYDYKLDRILVVDAPIEQQILRVTARDKISRAHVENIIAQQIPREERLARANDIIENSTNELHSLNDQVDVLHKHYLQLAQQK